MNKRNKILSIMILTVIIGSSITGILLYQNFTNKNTSPSARYGSSMIYDSVLKKVILFGGGYQSSDINMYYNDTWFYTAETNTWEELYTVNKPSPRAHHGMVYDPDCNITLLYGGWDPINGRMNDTWVFTSENYTWNQVYPEHIPSVTDSFSLYYDPNFQKIILFGGYADVGDHSNEMWEYDSELKDWTKLNTTGSPQGRYGHSMIYDTLNQRSILFGGNVYGAGISDDFYAFYYENLTWTKFNTTEKPGARYWYGLVHDPVTNLVYVFGGRNNIGTISAGDDTWVYSIENDTWTEIVIQENPSNRMSFAAIFDQESQIFIIFGGFRFYDVNLGDTWTFKHENGNWTHQKGNIE